MSRVAKPVTLSWYLPVAGDSYSPPEFILFIYNLVSGLMDKDGVA